MWMFSKTITILTVTLFGFSNLVNLWNYAKPKKTSVFHYVTVTLKYNFELSSGDLFPQKSIVTDLQRASC